MEPQGTGASIFRTLSRAWDAIVETKLIEVSNILKNSAPLQIIFPNELESTLEKIYKSEGDRDQVEKDEVKNALDRLENTPIYICENECKLTSEEIKACKAAFPKLIRALLMYKTGECSILIEGQKEDTVFSVDKDDTNVIYLFQEEGGKIEKVITLLAPPPAKLETAIEITETHEEYPQLTLEQAPQYQQTVVQPPVSQPYPTYQQPAQATTIQPPYNPSPNSYQGNGSFLNPAPVQAPYNPTATNLFATNPNLYSTQPASFQQVPSLNTMQTTQYNSPSNLNQWNNLYPTNPQYPAPVQPNYQTATYPNSTHPNLYLPQPAAFHQTNPLPVAASNLYSNNPFVTQPTSTPQPGQPYYYASQNQQLPAYAPQPPVGYTPTPGWPPQSQPHSYNPPYPPAGYPPGY